MATKVVTFRLPEDLMEAITSQAQATGRPKTAVVVEALKQVFGNRCTQTPTVSIDLLHQQQEAIRPNVVSLNQQPAELKPATAPNLNSQRLAECDQALFDGVSTILPKDCSPPNPGIAVNLTDPSLLDNSASKSQSGIPIQETLQLMAAEVEQRARMLEQVLSASVDHVCMHDRLGRYTYANRAFMQSFKLERVELYGKTWRQVGLPAATMKPFEAKLQIALATGQSIAEEISLPTVNGLRDYEYILSPIYSSDGSIEAVVYTARDITERKQAEEALRESEKNYRNLFEWAHDSIFITDSSTQTLLDVNEHAARRLGYTRKQLLSLPPEVYSPPMEAKHREEVLRLLWQTGHVVFEHIHNCKDGKQMPVEISSRVIEYEGQLAIQSFVRDITVRKQAEEKLALYRDIVTRTQEPLAILDLQGYYIEQNPAHQSLLGYPKEKLFGRTAAFHLGKEKFAQILQSLKEKGSYSGEVTSRNNSGETLTLQLDAYILRNQAGDPIWYLFLPQLTQTLE